MINACSNDGTGVGSIHARRVSISVGRTCDERLIEDHSIRSIILEQVSFRRRIPAVGDGNTLKTSRESIHCTRFYPGNEAMPIYEYGCEKCGHEFEAIQKISEEPLKTCPACGQDALRKKVSAAGFRLKGGGWYETDFKKSGDRKRNLESSGSSDSSSGSSGASAPSPASSSSGGDSSSSSKSGGSDSSA